MRRCEQRNIQRDQCIHNEGHIGCCETEPYPLQKHGFMWWPNAVIDRDPIACRSRFHGKCIIETLGDGSKRHINPNTGAINK